MNQALRLGKIYREQCKLREPMPFPVFVRDTVLVDQVKYIVCDVIFDNYGFVKELWLSKSTNDAMPVYDLSEYADELRSLEVRL